MQYYDVVFSTKFTLPSRLAAVLRNLENREWSFLMKKTKVSYYLRLVPCTSGSQRCIVCSVKKVPAETDHQRKNVIYLNQSNLYDRK